MVVGLVVLAVVLVGILGIVGYAIVIYNGLVALKNNIDKAWSNIDVLLKQRFDELPKLVEVCKGYMNHERETLEAVVKARSMIESASGEQQNLKAQTAVTQAVRGLFAVSERYPELKADTSFRQLQTRVSELEDQIADRREFYNESANIYNIRIEQVPDMFIAKPMNFTKRSLWEIEPSHREDPGIKFGA
jgi:LemA protein